MVKIWYFVWAMFNLLCGIFVFAFIAASLEVIFEAGNIKYSIALPIFLLSLKGIYCNLLDVKKSMKMIHDIEDGLF